MFAQMAASQYLFKHLLHTYESFCYTLFVIRRSSIFKTVS